jgi:trehalose-6-phosphate synthase
MPLTPLEYILSNSWNGQIILSDSIWAYNLLTPYCYSFKSNNKISLANTIKKCIETCKKSKNNKILKMRQIVKSNCLENYTNLILKILLWK